MDTIIRELKEVYLEFNLAKEHEFGGVPIPQDVLVRLKAKDKDKIVELGLINGEVKEIEVTTTYMSDGKQFKKDKLINSYEIKGN